MFFNENLMECNKIAKLLSVRKTLIEIYLGQFLWMDGEDFLFYN